MVKFKKFMRAGVFALFALSLFLNVYGHFRSVELANKYELLSCLSGQSYQPGIIPFISSSQGLVSDKPIEIFDIVKGQVIKKVKSTQSIQDQTLRYLDRISGLSVNVNVFPDKGYIVRIPISPKVQVKNHWLNDNGIHAVDEVFVMLPAQDNPYLLLFDDRSRPYCFVFIGTLDVLLKELGFYPIPA